MPSLQDSSHLTVVAPKDALQRAQPLPSDDDMAVEGLTDEEWNVFEHAIALGVELNSGDAVYENVAGLVLQAPPA